MRLLRLDEAAFGPDDTVFKENPTQALLFTAMFVAGALFFLGLWIEDEVGTFLGVLMVGMFGVFAAFTGNIARKAFRPNAWQMAVDGRRALIKFRSFLNTLHPETDPQVLEVGLDEIASVRENELVMLTAGHRGRKATTIERSVDIRVPGADLRPLAERLEVEREWKRTGFSIKAWPVALPEEGVIRVNFSSNVSHVKPPVGEAVRLLAVRSRGEPK
ncbi:MAG TPA: hypothetical protein VFX98_11385, partial [Longimicrobiaceae bacterium]|nr:hypothetical protein [Longimicrobiaceae bacterium]